MIAIGDYYFKINFETEKVYALHKQFTNQLSDLENENITNENLLQFSTGDDVLAIIESGDLREHAGGRSEILCFREGGAGARESKYQDIQIVSNGSAPVLVMNADMKHVYQKAGIYFSLMLELKYMWKIEQCAAISCYKQLSTEIWANGTYRMRQKCKNNDTGYRSFGFWIDSNKLNHRFWENASALQVIYLDTNFTWVHVGYNTSLPPATSNSDLPLFFQRKEQRSYRLQPIYDNI